MRANSVLVKIFLVISVFGYSLQLESANASQVSRPQIFAGKDFACALLNSDDVRCWGTNKNGELGQGTRSWSEAPSQIAGLSNVRTLALGDNNACAVLNSGSVKCWGWINIGQGVGIYPPTTITGLSNVISVGIGYEHYCALLDSGEVKCWGRGDYGQLGNGCLWNCGNSGPALVEGLTNVISIGTGRRHNCALLTSKTVKCWGAYPAVGIGQAPSNPWGPDPGTLYATLVPNLSDVKSLSVGRDSTCAILISGEVKCWGYNGTGQLATGDMSEKYTPETIPSLSNAESISIGYGHGCALFASRQTKCWGYNYYGQVGYGFQGDYFPGSSYVSNTVKYVYSPTTVSILGGSSSLALGGTFSCAALVTGKVKCWGWNLTHYSAVDYYTSWESGAITAPQEMSNLTLPTPAGSVASLTVEPGSGQAIVSFMPPANDGGAEISNYEYSTDGGSTWTGASPSQTSGPIVITGLTNGTTYSVELRAVNGVGSGTESTAVSVTPQATASAPAIYTVTAASHQATASFSAPSDDGGASISNYEYSTDDGSTWTAASPAQTSSPLVITGLTNGTTYSVKLRAVNSVGSGAESNAISVKPIAPATEPTVSGVTSVNGQATLTIAAPSQINDSSLSGYDYSTNNGSTWSHFASVDGPFTITGLTNGTAYQVKVRAVNSAGPGAASDAVTVNPTKLVPATPSIASITRGNGQATVNVAPATGVTAQSITAYQYNLNKGALWKPVTVTNGSFTITGLTNGSNYAVQIRAININGLSGLSGKVSVTPMTTATATTIQSIKSLNGGLAVTFGGAINNGGSIAKNYQYSLDGGSTWTDCTPALKLGPLMTIKGLTNGATYQVAIRLVNAVGPGAASNVVSATPMTTPSKPVIANASVSKTTATLTLGSFGTGGTPITGYAYSLDNKTWTIVTPDAGQFTVSGLTSFKSYKIYLRASNLMGNGIVASTTVKTLK